MAMMSGLRQKHFDVVRATHGSSKGDMQPATSHLQQEALFKETDPTFDSSLICPLAPSTWQLPASDASPLEPPFQKGPHAFCASPVSPLFLLGSSPSLGSGTWEGASSSSSPFNSGPPSPRPGPAPAFHASSLNPAAGPFPGAATKRPSSGPRDPTMALREQVLIRTASGASCDSSSSAADLAVGRREEDLAHCVATCLNLEAVERTCAALDIAERRVEGLSIVLVDAPHLADSRDQGTVLFALFVAGEIHPRIPGDDQILSLVPNCMEL